MAAIEKSHRDRLSVRRLIDQHATFILGQLVNRSNPSIFAPFAFSAPLR